LRLRLDEMVPVRVARRLRAEGFDVDAVAESPGLRGLADDEQLARAAAERRALVTYDAGDFLALAARRSASGEGHSALILLRSDRFPQGDPDRIAASLRQVLANPERVSAMHWLE
jgi:predicted nuclease of predicted toxin-antitoxin system